MRLQKFLYKHDLFKCGHTVGNGANWYICNISKDKCPYQHICSQDRVFELIGACVKCPNYIKKQ